MMSLLPRSSSSCAACKFLKRRCTPNCLFAPYFRSDEPKKFARVHKVFGASNVTKILNEVPEEQREDTVSSLVFEAEARLRDPVYGCIGAIASLQGRMFQLQQDLAMARAKLAARAASSSSSSSVSMSPLMVLDHEHGDQFSLDSLYEFAGGLVDWSLIRLAQGMITSLIANSLSHNALCMLLFQLWNRLEGISRL